MNQKNPHLFQKQNYYLMLFGAFLFLLGIVFMVGGKNDNPDVFDAQAIYSFSRITLAPILMALGFVVEVVAVLYRKKKN